MHVVRGGDGKSRIAIALIIILLMTKTNAKKDICKVHLVFSNETLMLKDKAYFEDIVTMAGLEAMLEYHFNLDFSPAVREVIVCDEADEHIFGNPTQFMKVTNRRNCVCFTATCDDGKESYECDVLKHMGFKIFKSEDQ